MTINIQIQNQQPAQLFSDPYAVMDVNPSTTDTDTFIKVIRQSIENRYVANVYTPLGGSYTPISATTGQTNAGQNASITDITDPTNPIDIQPQAMLEALMMAWFSPTLDAVLQDQLSEIFRQALQFYQPNDWYFDEQLKVEALTRHNLPLPANSGTRIVRYSATNDVIPSAKNFLADMGNADKATEWFATMSGFLHERISEPFLGISFQSSREFDEFKTFVASLVAQHNTNGIVSQETRALFNEFNNIDLQSELNAALFLPNGGFSPMGSKAEFEELSFSRILLDAYQQFELLKNASPATRGHFTVQPYHISSVYLPTNIVMMNVENYAHANGSDVTKSWDDIEKALQINKSFNYITNRNILTAQSVINTIGGGQSDSQSSKYTPITRLKMRKFSGKPVTQKQLGKMMKKIIESQTTNKQTQNFYKTSSNTYMRPNRRRPLDINAQGKITKTSYRPDIHIYLDTSGSIEESQYRDAVVNLIVLSQQINCNLYVTSFSHVVSQTTLVQTRGASVRSVYNQFQSIPKVSGGTDFENVWTKIDKIDAYNRRTGNSHQINFVITDFGYVLNNGKRWSQDQASLRNTFYAPISANPQTWSYILEYARDFSRSMMRAGDKSIRQRMLM